MRRRRGADDRARRAVLPELYDHHSARPARWTVDAVHDGDRQGHRRGREGGRHVECREVDARGAGSRRFRAGTRRSRATRVRAGRWTRPRERPRTCVGFRICPELTDLDPAERRIEDPGARARRTRHTIAASRRGRAVASGRVTSITDPGRPDAIAQNRESVARDENHVRLEHEIARFVEHHVHRRDTDAAEVVRLDVTRQQRGQVGDHRLVGVRSERARVRACPISARGGRWFRRPRGIPTSSFDPLDDDAIVVSRCQSRRRTGTPLRVRLRNSVSYISIATGWWPPPARSDPPYDGSFWPSRNLRRRRSRVVMTSVSQMPQRDTLDAGSEEFGGIRRGLFRPADAVQGGGDVDFDSLKRVVDLIVGAGVNGVTALGVTGEVVAPDRARARASSSRPSSRRSTAAPRSSSARRPTACARASSTAAKRRRSAPRP